MTFGVLSKRSWAAWESVIDRLVNHSMGSLRSRYQLWSFATERRVAMVTWDRHLASLIGGPSGS